jgi:mannose-6-phosphate isomerase-like protein (cupin superfamily)
MADIAPILAGKNEGTAIWHMGALLVFKATSAQTNGQYWLAEQTSRLNYASPVHVHGLEDETFHVLDGTLTLEIDGQPYLLEQGATLFAPRGLPHSYKVESQEARWLVLGTPGGFDGWFFDTGKPAEALVVPEFNPADFPSFPDVIASVEKYGAKVLGPPRD